MECLHSYKIQLYRYGVRDQVRVKLYLYLVSTPLIKPMCTHIGKVPNVDREFLAEVLANFVKRRCCFDIIKFSRGGGFRNVKLKDCA